MKITITKDELMRLIDTQQIEITVTEPVPEPIKAQPEPKPEQPKPKEEPKKKAKVIDHGKIVACDKGGRSVSWIADDMKISPQTVINHLEKEGIYKKI